MHLSKTEEWMIQQPHNQTTLVKLDSMKLGNYHPLTQSLNGYNSRIYIREVISIKSHNTCPGTSLTLAIRHIKDTI